MSTQLNIKLDAKLKKEADHLAKQLGLSLSGILRAFLLHFVRSKRIEFSLNDAETDTPHDLDGKNLERELLKAGYSKAHAKKQGGLYDAMLQAEEKNLLIEF